MANETQTVENTVKRGRGRPRIHEVNVMDYVRSPSFPAGANAFLNCEPAHADDNQVNAMGRKFAAWFVVAFPATPLPSIPAKGQWLNHFQPFMAILPAAKAAGVFEMTASEEVRADEVVAGDQDNHIDLSLLQPVADTPSTPVRGPGGRFLPRASSEPTPELLTAFTL